MRNRHKRQILLSMILVVMLALIASGGVAFGKAHVPAGEFQVSHQNKALNVNASALGAHLNHGDIRLPACDFGNVFGENTDTSDVVATNVDKKGKIHKIKDGHIKKKLGVLYADGTFVVRIDAGGATPACPPGTF